MGLLKKLELHFQDKFGVPTCQGIKLGLELTENAPAPVKAAGFIGGYAAGSVVGALRLWNPLDIADSLLTPEEEMQEKVEKKLEAAKFDV